MQCKQRNKQGKVEEPSKQANPPLKLNYYFAFVSNLRAEVTHKTEVKRDKVGSFSKNFKVYKKKWTHNKSKTSFNNQARNDAVEIWYEILRYSKLFGE